MSSSNYDSRPDTHEHIAKVRGYLLNIAVMLTRRGHEHDASKLLEPEVEVFDEFTPKLKDSTYGSDEYKAFLVGMGKGLRHHYQHNDHHPEHHEDGVRDMDLLQVMEMLADWRAATQRHADGDLARSIEINAERFGYGDEFKRLLVNTAGRLGWINLDPMLEDLSLPTSTGTASDFDASSCCWHAEGWEMANELSVRDARITTRAQAHADWAMEDGTLWTEVGVWKRYIRGLDRQEQYEWWVETRTDGWDVQPDEAPIGWKADPWDEGMPYWQFVNKSHPDAVPVWICGLRAAGAPSNPTKGST